ncbi:MAG: hypothetical protein GWO24_16265, partial [Akkermansiaceae bacterium]|nr:hypothetical protein [Akkermansiaceae bacterium]
ALFHVNLADNLAYGSPEQHLLERLCHALVDYLSAWRPGILGEGTDQ